MTESAINERHQLSGPTAFSHRSGKLIKFLEQYKDSFDTITYEQFEQVAGVGCRPGEKGYSNLQTAIRFMERTHGKLFGNVRTVGVKQWRPGEAALEVDGTKQGVTRKARRGVRRAQHIDINELDDDGKRTLLANVSQLGAMAMFGSADSHKKLAASVNGHAIEVDPKKLLEVFKH